MGHVVQKSEMSLTKVEQKLDIKLTERYDCVAYALFYSIYCSMISLTLISLTQKFLWSVQVEAT